MGAFSWLIQKQLQYILDDYESYGVSDEKLPLVKNLVEQLADDWICLGRLTIPWRLTDADEVLGDLGRRSIIQKIEDVGGDICRELGKRVPTPRLLLQLLDGCQRTTDEILKAEIVESWEFLLNSGFRVQHPADQYSWTIFLGSFRESLRLACADADGNFFQEQVSVLVSHLDIMQIYLGGLQKLCYSIFIGSPEIRYLIRHVVCVAVRIAIQSCICRFNRRDPKRAKIEFARLLDLYYDISPANLEFILLNLRVREAVSIITARMGSSIITAHSARVGSDFLGVDFYYPLHWIGEADLRRGPTSFLSHFSNSTLRNDSDGEIVEADLKRELMYLLTLCSKSTLRNDSDGEGVRSLSTEIKALLEEAAFLSYNGKR